MRIRPVEAADAAAIQEINADTAKHNIFNIADRELEDAAKFISGLTFFDHMLVLETETPPVEICGAVLLHVDPQIYRRRCATLKVMVAEKWRGQGLGKALVSAALDLADNELMMERVEVEIPTDNVNALKLCKACGFKVEGTAKDWLRTLDGEYADAYLMAHCRGVR